MKEKLEILIVIPIFILLAPVAVLSSLFNIFLPVRMAYNKDHLNNCWLKHGGIVAGFWHFIDTRASLLSFDGMGSRPPKMSVNRTEWLRHEKDFFESEIKRGGAEYPEGYKEYILEELSKVNQELTPSPQSQNK